MQVPKCLLLKYNSSNELDIEDFLSIMGNHRFLQLNILVHLLCLLVEEGVSSVEKIAKVDKEKDMNQIFPWSNIINSRLSPSFLGS